MTAQLQQHGPIVGGSITSINVATRFNAIVAGFEGGGRPALADLPR
jgi:hypothetical protein